MRQTVAKKLRKIVSPVDSTTRRVYRRLKKTYARLSKHAKSEFFQTAQKVFSSPTSEV